MKLLLEDEVVVVRKCVCVSEIYTWYMFMRKLE